MKFLNIIFCGLTSILIFVHCQKKEVFQPVYQSKSDFLKDSQEYSKSREESERKYLQNWVKKQKDSLNQTFDPTSSGIWIRFIEKKNQTKVKTGNIIKYSAEIKTLDNETIYTSTEFGEKQGIVGKFKDIRGIESALLLMGTGDKTEILLPSFSAYGLYGDENKIGANVPLLIELHLIEIK